MPYKDQAANNACYKYKQTRLFKNIHAGSLVIQHLNHVVCTVFTLSNETLRGPCSFLSNVYRVFSPVVRLSSPTILRFRVPETTIPPHYIIMVWY
jgi:hypothetical protein